MGGFPYEWDYLGEEADLPTRGRMLDEHLDLLVRLWSGGPVEHRGEHYRVAGTADHPFSARLHPPPVQQPRIPVWVAGSAALALVAAGYAWSLASLNARSDEVYRAALAAVPAAMPALVRPPATPEPPPPP